MPFGSAQSPSVRKMEHGMGGRPRFAFGRVIGDPFSLATVSVATVCSPAFENNEFRDSEIILLEEPVD